jgi:hypothetical protein
MLSAQSFYEAMGTPFEAVSQSFIAFADVDGDSDQDVLITGRNETGDYIAKLYTNDGTGNYSESMGIPIAGYDVSSFAFEDVDGDNDQDVFITGYTNTFELISRLYTNDGMGNFSEAMGGSFEPINDSSLAFADVDNDNDRDVLITGTSFSGSLISRLYTNDGLGNFTEVTGTPFEGAFLSSTAFADVDGDNDQDILIAGRNKFGEPLAKMYLNDGVGNFSISMSLPFETIRIISVAFADVDGDNDQDVLITGGDSGLDVSALYINDGMGNFTEATGAPFAGVSRNSSVFADVDGDNDHDLLITGRPNSGIWISKLYINDGIGNFSEVMNTPFEGVESGSIAFADVDGDNDQDVLITGRSNSGGSISKLYINDGTSSSDDFNFEFNLDFTIYPNPLTANNLNISYDSEQNGFLTISVTDLNGKVVSQLHEFVSSGQQTISIDITSLIQGSYVIELNDGKRRGIAKFIVL